MPPGTPAGPLIVTFTAPAAGQAVEALGTVVGGAARVDLPLAIKAANAVKVELSRDAPSAACPSCGDAFYTWTAPSSSTDTYTITMCANCFDAEETLPRAMTLHARAYDALGNTKQADVTVMVTLPPVEPDAGAPRQARLELVAGSGASRRESRARQS